MWGPWRPPAASDCADLPAQCPAIAPGSAYKTRSHGYRRWDFAHFDTGRKGDEVPDHVGNILHVGC